MNLFQEESYLIKNEDNKLQNSQLIMQLITIALIFLKQNQQLMGNCTGQSLKLIKKKVSDEPTNKKQAINIIKDQKEVHCLRLIYKDLAQRCRQKNISLKIFQLFFHMNHVVGGALFRIFSNNNATNEITQQMFIESILRLSKADLNQKIRLLFSIYDLNYTKGISFNQFLAMVPFNLYQLLSFPQQQMKQILNKDQFLQSLTADQISYYLIASKKNSIQKLNKQYKSTLSLFPHVPLRKKSTNFDTDPYFTNNMFKINFEIKSKGENNHQSQVQKNNHNDQVQKLKEQLKKNIDKSILTTQIIRKYCQYIFKKFNIDRQSQQMGYQIFKSLLLQHPSLYQQFFDGFHQYLWAHQNGVPLYKKKPPRIWGFCTEKCGEEKKKVFLITLRNSLLTFENELTNRPISIRNLQGLLINQIEGQQGYGFSLKEQDGFYKQHSFYFQNKQIQKNWLIQLKQFVQQDIFKKYRILQRIGKGNFSSVHKCQSLQDGQKRAIKIIQKAKVTQQQIAAVHYQSQILATCAMPNVLRAYERFQTNTHIYLVTQLIQGVTLHQYVKNKKQNRLSQIETKKIMFKLLTAVDRFHEIGIIHRDLKLQNILMKFQENQYIPKIIDFGLAAYKINLKNMDESTLYGGTPNYIPPEIFFHSQFNETIDIFSLGVIMHYMLTGFLPFHGHNIKVIRQLTIQCFINFQSKRWLNISQSAKDLLSKMICQKDYRATASQALNHQWFKQSNLNNPQY